MLYSYLRVWKSRGSSAGALGDTSNLNSDPHCGEVIFYHIDACWHWRSLISGYPGTTSLPVQHPEPESYWIEELPGFWWGRLPYACHLPLWHLGEAIVRSSLGFMGTRGNKEQFLCKNTLDSVWLRRGVTYAKILEGPNCWRVAFDELRHIRIWFSITNLCSVGCNNQLWFRQGVGFKGWATHCRNLFPCVICAFPTCPPKSNINF